MSYTYLMKNKMHIIITGLVIVVLAMSAYLIWQSMHFQVASQNTSGPIFSVASSTGETFFTITADGKVGIGSTSENPTTALEVAGPIRMTTKSSVSCSAAIEGTIAYNPDNKHFWGCNGNSWNMLDK